MTTVAARTTSSAHTMAATTRLTTLRIPGGWLGSTGPSAATTALRNATVTALSAAIGVAVLIAPRRTRQPAGRLSVSRRTVVRNACGWTVAEPLQIVTDRIGMHHHPPRMCRMSSKSVTICDHCGADESAYPWVQLDEYMWASWASTRVRGDECMGRHRRDFCNWSCVRDWAAKKATDE